MSFELRLLLANDLDELPAAADHIVSFLEQHDCPSEVVFAANLAAEELFTNIVKYGYDDTSRHEVSFLLSLAPGLLTIEVRDDGHEFNPFEQPAPDTSLPIEQRDIGGLGIHFVKNLLDSFSYQRRDGYNIVTLTKKV